VVRVPVQGIVSHMTPKTCNADATYRIYH
jgi:hypothetical protein